MPHANPVANAPFVVPVGPGGQETGVNAPTTVGDLSIGSHQRKVDDTNPALIYVGFAVLGALESDSAWVIFRCDLATGYVWQQAGGAWLDRANLEYT